MSELVRDHRLQIDRAGLQRSREAGIGIEEDIRIDDPAIHKGRNVGDGQCRSYGAPGLRSVRKRDDVLSIGRVRSRGRGLNGSEVYGRVRDVVPTGERGLYRG